MFHLLRLITLHFLPSSTLQEAFFWLSTAIWFLSQSHRTIERQNSPSPKMKEQHLVVVQSSFLEKSQCWTLLEADHHTTKIKDGAFDLQELFGVANKTRGTYLSEHHYYHFHSGVKCCPVSESLVWGQRSWVSITMRSHDSQLKTPDDPELNI